MIRRRRQLRARRMAFYILSFQTVEYDMPTDVLSLHYGLRRTKLSGFKPIYLAEMLPTV